MRTIETTIEHVRERAVKLNPVDRRIQLDRLVYLPTTADRLPMLKAVVDPDKATEIVLPNIALSDHAHNQLMQRVGYPTKLLDRLPENNIFMDVNHLIQHADDGRNTERMSLLRLVNPIREVYVADASTATARAVLGARYSPLDDLELIEIVSEYVAGSTVRYENLGELSTHLTLTFPASAVIDGDPSQSIVRRGLHIMNSEVGMRSITIEAIVWRDVCSNVMPSRGFGAKDAMTTNTDSQGRLYVRSSKNSGRAYQGTKSGGWRMRHTGDPDALRVFVRDAIEDSKLEFEGLLGAWRNALNTVVQSPTDAIEAVARAEQITPDMLSSVMIAYGAESAESGSAWSHSALGVANAFTRAANEQLLAEPRYQLQVAGRQALAHLN